MCSEALSAAPTFTPESKARHIKAPAEALYNETDRSAALSGKCWAEGMNKHDISFLQPERVHRI